jgi:hypothetical protein
MTAQELIESSMRVVNALQTGQSATTAERNDGLAALNQILAGWSNEGMSAYNITHGTFTAAAGTTSYTMGSGGTWSTSARPTKVYGAFATSGNFRQGLGAPLSAEEFAQLSDGGAGITASLPTKWTVDNGSPLRTAQIFPPLSGSASINVAYALPITALALGDSLAFPPGWDQALRFALAITLAPEYGHPVTQEMIMLATNAKQEIMTTPPAAAPVAA